MGVGDSDAPSRSSRIKPIERDAQIALETIGTILENLHSAQAEERLEPTTYCHSPESGAEWDQLLAQHPHDQGLQTLHALRLGICLKVDPAN
jgi:hypothetical protein